MKRILYITYNDPPSGIYKGQVIDVCDFLHSEIGGEVRLLALISARSFRKNAKWYHNMFPASTVCRMFPRVRNWNAWWNRWQVQRTIRAFDPDVVICRGPFAFHLAFRKERKFKIIFDARAAYAAEFREYDVAGDAGVTREIPGLEADCLKTADMCLAVSHELVNYWKDEYVYATGKHVVIPCTLSEKSEKENSGATIKFPFDTSADKIIVFSGSLAGWHSLNQIKAILKKIFAEDPTLRLLMLTPDSAHVNNLISEFPGKVKREWVDHRDVHHVMEQCDYGWLVRENSVTNKVASPVKFAEYIAAGLPVIISDHLGDMSEFVRRNNAGIVVTGSIPLLPKTGADTRARMKGLADVYFRKKAFIDQYKLLVR